MNVLQQIESTIDSLALSEAKVAHVILDAPEAASSFSIARLAEEAETSTSAVQRLCQSLGVSGYKELRYALASQRLEPEGAIGDDGDPLLQAVDRLASAVAALSRLDRSLLDELAQSIVSSSAVYCMGVYRSGLPAQKLCMDLRDLKVLALDATDVVDTTHLMGLADHDTCVILFSVAGSNIASRGGAAQREVPAEHTWLVTTNARPRVGKEWGHVIVLPSAAAGFAGQLDDHTVMMAFVELLVQLVRARLEA